MTKYNLSNLEYLEAESIHIIREMVAEFENPVHAIILNEARIWEIIE